MPSSASSFGWGALLKLEVNSLLSVLGQGSTSKDFFELIRDIGESRSKQEEDKILEREVTRLKSAIGKPDNSKGLLKELLVRLIYCEMLGHNAAFGYIHAVKMTQEQKVLDKRVGYLAVSVLLHENSEFMMLLINSFRRDLESPNYIDTCSALTAMCFLLNAEAVPALLPVIVDRLLEHPRELVRKKAVMVLQRILSRSPESVGELLIKIRKALCDRDPAVMSASLCVYYDLVKENPMRYKELVPSLVSILKQIIERRLPIDFEYHKVPAPWLQIKILKILAMLGVDDQKTSEHMYEIIFETMKRADINSNTGYAIVYECIQTITKVYPNNYLLDAAATSISKFIGTGNHNLKYLGITALALLVQVSPKYAAAHQLAVIDCLEDPDETLRRKTLDLLYKMTNPKNVVVITDKLIEFLGQTTDTFLKAELVSRITQNAERYAPNNQWFVKIMNKVFFLGGEYVRPEVAHNLMQLIAEGTGEDEASDEQLRVYAVNTFLRSLTQPMVPNILLQVISWVLGEYGYLSELPLPEIIDRLCDLLSKPSESADSKGWIISALAKLISQMGGRLTDQVDNILRTYSNSRSVDVQQKCYEVRELSKTPKLMQEVFPVDASCEDISVDENLIFLNSYVNNAIRVRKVKPYIPHHERQFEEKAEPQMPKARPIRWTAYETPKTDFGILGLPPSASLTPTQTPVAAPESFSSIRPTSSGLNLPSASKWTESGYADAQEELERPSFGASSPFTSPAAVVEQPVAPVQTPTPKARTDPKAIALSLEQEKKSKLATALFKTVDSPSESTGTKKKPKPPKRTTKASTAVASASSPAPAAASTSSPILSLDEITSPVVAPSPPSSVSAAPTPTKSVDDLLLGLGDLGVSSSPVRSTPPKAAATSSLLELDDIFSTPVSVPQPSPTVSTPTPMPSLLMTNDQPEQPLASLLVPSKFVATSAEDSAFLALQTSGFPRSHDTKQLLTKSDSQLSISYFKCWKPDETLVVLFFGNSGAGELLKCTASLETPANLKSELVGDKGVTIRHNQVLIQSLAPKETTVALVKLRFRQHSFSANIEGKVQYVNDQKENKHVSFSVAVDLIDLLRPNPINTPKFGELWPSHTHESKAVFTSTNFKSPKEYLTFLQSKLNVHPIEIIGIEAIASAKLINSESLVMVHSKINNAGIVEVTVRTKDKLFTDVVIRYLQRIIK
eukprot:TRINITY_DN5972_c0_g1_i1.p1 TRINITY_DN5972_c0_g1~~TRINITY_DN5972_c0_g1_i1.p1  ORF type:complete len:1192 (-),score=301.43 TRINITY_DN5972_c0_g1_i1:58-3633(-)